MCVMAFYLCLFVAILIRLLVAIFHPTLTPAIADSQLKAGTQFTMLPTDDKWFGVTYKEDKPAVMESFRELIRSGAYGEM